MIDSGYPQIANFLDFIKLEKRYSRHTIISYQNDLSQFFSFVNDQFSHPSLPEINSTYIRSWLAGLKDQNITSKSINRKISALRSFFKFLLKQNIIECSPMSAVIAPKNNKRLPAFIDENHLERLFNDIEFSNDWSGRTENIILQLLYNTGMRVSELVNLKKENVDFSYSQIKILGKGNKERIIPVHKKLLLELHDYIKDSEALHNNAAALLMNKKGKPLYSRYVYNIVKKNLSLVSTSKKKSPHILRHSFATHLANNGADLNAIKELLGHSSLAATQVYTHNNIDRLKEVFKKAHPKA